MGKRGLRFCPFTCIRQTGTQRQTDGTTISTFVARVRGDLAPFCITLQVSPTLSLSSGAVFDPLARADVPEEDDHRGEGQMALFPDAHPLPERKGASR